MKISQMRKVTIIGANEIKWGVLKERTFEDMAAEAGNGAIKDSGIDRKAIQCIYIGNYAANETCGLNVIPGVIADAVGLPNVPGMRFENACSSGAVALREAFFAVAFGVYDFVMVLGIEKLNTMPTLQMMDVIARGLDPNENYRGLNAPSLYAMYARALMKKYGYTKEMMAHVSAKSYYNGALNPVAHWYPKGPVSVEEVMNAPIVAYPLGRHDCSLTTDGAAALVLCPAEIAKNYNAKPIEIIASAMAGETMRIAYRDDFTSFGCTVRAAKMAYEMARIEPKDVSFAEVHDCFSSTELIDIEDLGFFPRGEGGPATMEGKTALNGEMPINASGGLKAKGHPIGSTAVGQYVEITKQMRGIAGPRQVKNTEIGLSHMLGGAPSVCTIHIFKKGF